MNIIKFFMLLSIIPMIMCFNSNYVLLQNNRLNKSVLRMTLSNNYLNSLNIQCKNVSNLYEKIKDSNETECDNVEITSVIFNIYKLKNIFFSKRSTSIMLNLRDNMKNIYLVNNNNDIEKISNKTKITAKYLKNFHIVELNPEYDIDAFIFKE